MNAPLVAVSLDERGIVLVTLQDRVGKNGFSLAFGAELKTAFAGVAADARAKVVVVTGCDTYFVSGGTREGLLAIADRKVRCTDLNVHRLLLDCRLPVIAAMQGHAIGAGLVFGLLADVVILSRESVYAANFMKYGFTPGFGSTLVLPKKLGNALADEMLISARNYRGAELEKRGVPFTVLPRAEVLPHALRLAEEIADKPVGSLKLLKEHLTADTRARLPAVIDRELEMHDITFGEAEVRTRIETRFGT